MYSILSLRDPTVVNSGRATQRTHHNIGGFRYRCTHPTSLTYPDGRVVTYNYGTGGGIDDAASRVSQLVDSDGSSTVLAEYEYLGLGTIVQVDHPQPDLEYTLIDLSGTVDPDTGDIYSGLDRFGRIKDCRWLDTTGPTDVARYKYGYDRASNRLWRQDTVATSQSQAFDELYEYDGLYRLKDMGRGTLNGTQTALTTTTFAQCWSLDETGNWLNFNSDDDGNGTWDLEQQRTASAVNEITGLTPPSSPSGYRPYYDPAGNLNRIPSTTTASGLTWPTLSVNEWDTLTVDEWDTLGGDAFEEGRTFVYDAWNRLRSVADAGNNIQINTYDGRNFRIIRNTTANASVTPETRHFYFTPGWQSIEERLGSTTTPQRQYVWGLRYIDDCVLRDRDITNNGSIDERFYPTQDANWNVTALVDDTGTVQERYAYSAYGVPTFLTATYGSRTSSSYDWQTLFCSYRYDPALDMYNVRNRVYHPELGVWIQRDPIGYVDGMNLYRAYFVPNGVDAYGTQSITDVTDILPPSPLRPIADLESHLWPHSALDTSNLPSDLSICELVRASLSNEYSSLGSTAEAGTARKCNVNIFCGFCGNNGEGNPLGGQTFINGGRIHICISSRAPWPDRYQSKPEDMALAQQKMEALLLHELVHATQLISEDQSLCSIKCHAGGNPRPGHLGGQPSPEACTRCKQKERAAYSRQALYLYPNSPATRAEFIRAGICYSCHHICIEYANTRCPPFPD